MLKLAPTTSASGSQLFTARNLKSCFHLEPDFPLGSHTTDSPYTIRSYRLSKHYYISTLHCGLHHVINSPIILQSVGPPSASTTSAGTSSAETSSAATSSSSSRQSREVSLDISYPQIKNLVLNQSNILCSQMYSPYHPPQFMRWDGLNVSYLGCSKTKKKFILNCRNFYNPTLLSRGKQQAGMVN